MRKILFLMFIISCPISVLAKEQPYAKMAELIMKYGNASYGENVFHKLGMSLDRELGDNENSSAFEGVDMNGKYLTAKLQRKNNMQDLDYIGFIIDTCYYDDVVKSLQGRAYILDEEDRKVGYGYGTIAHQKIFKSDKVVCVLQIGNNYLSGKLYIYYTYRFKNNNKIFPGKEDIAVEDLNTIFDPGNKYDTDWNETEIDPDWLADVGVYFDKERNKYFELKPFYDLRNSKIKAIDGIVANPAKVKRPAIENALEPIRKINAEKSQILEDINRVDYIQPQFPGGDMALRKFISKNFKMPKGCEISRARAVASFDIDEEGKVVNVRIYRGVNKEIDEEFIRVIKSLPRFEPGTADGKPHKFTGFKIPLNIGAQN